MTSILNAKQRAVIAADTHIDRLLIDRVVEAYDALLADNYNTYVFKMRTAIAQMNYGRPIRPSDRPTAVDVVRVIIQRACADKWQVSFQVATRRLQDRINEFFGVPQ
jgi:hypothetical protein